MNFQEPDEKTIARMTVQSLTALLAAIRSQREEACKPFDEQIKFYKRLLDKKKEEGNAKTGG